MAYQRTLKRQEFRRIGKDQTYMSTDIHIVRWFSMFLKLTKELESKKTKFDLYGKTYQVKIDTSKDWFKKIKVNELPKSLKFLRFKYENYNRDTKRYFDNYFFQKYRPLFIEPQTMFVNSPIEVDTSKYDLIAIPKHLNFTSKKSSFINLLNSDEKTLVSKKRGRKKTGQNDGQFKADVVLYGAKDLVLKRLFHMFRIYQSKIEEFTFFDVWNNYENQINKRPLVQLKRIKEGALHGRTKSNVQDYESQIRMTQRDIRQAKVLILNLCKGQFPITDKLI